MEIQLSQGKVALIDDIDYERVNRWSWHFDGRYARGYPHGIKEYLHRYIMQTKSGEVVDHINGDRLDNRRANLRNCSHAFNASNRHGPVTNKHGLRGVYRAKGRKWRAEIYWLGKHYALGTFSSAVEANAAYEEAKVLLHNGHDITKRWKKVGSR